MYLCIGYYNINSTKYVSLIIPRMKNIKRILRIIPFCQNNNIFVSFKFFTSIQNKKVTCLRYSFTSEYTV